uniref:Integrase catalytic domain-containing protein n=1 Tax=Tanacetum cinerariifolium TaxID=118510 RepID=A0A6L2LZ43_TANCI|nr:hypothetical protein [Tanacetum cinerariifolium]
MTYRIRDSTRHLTRSPFLKVSNSPPRVTAVKAAVVVLLRGNPQHALKDKGVIDSRCSRNMTVNMSYLSDFEELNGGYVAFRGKSKDGSLGYFSATKDETSPILKTFITGLENQLSLKVKVIRSDNGTEFKNYDLNQFCGIKGIKKEFSIPRTLQQNGIAKRKNKTLIEAARTILADSLLPILFWAKAVNTTCYVQNRIPYEKFDGKIDEGFLVGHSVSSKAFRVFNSRTRIVQESLHVNFMESKPNVAGSGPTWLFDIDSLTKTINYQPVTAGNQSNHCKDAAFDKKEPDFDAKNPESEVIVSPSNDPNMPELEDITYSDDEDDVGAKADFNNLETSIIVSLIPTTRVHKDHLVTQIIGDLSSATQTMSMTRVAKDHGGLSQMFNDDLNTFDLPHGKRAIGTKWVFRNKKDERGIVIRNKARFVTQGHTQEDGINYEEVFAPVARIEAIRLFLAYASFMGFMVYQLDVKSAFLYGTIEEEVHVSYERQVPDEFNGRTHILLGLQVKQKKDAIFISQDKYVAEILRKFGLTEGKSASTPIDTEKPLLKDPDGEDIDVHTYRSMIGSLMYLTSSRPDIMFAVCACARFHVTSKASDLHAVKRIFRYLKGKPYLGLWYPKDSPFDLVAYSDSDYAGASLDRKSTTRGYQMVSGKDSSHPLMADSLPKNLWYSTHHVTLMKSWLVQKQTALGVNTPRSDDDRLELMELTVFLSPKCMSAKRTSWNEFSSSMASAVIGLSSGKGFSGVKTPLFEGMLVEHQVIKEGDADGNDETVNAGDAAEGDVSAAHGEIPIVDEEPSIPSPTPPTPPPQSPQGRMIAEMDQDADVVLEDDKEDDREVADAVKDVKVNESVDIQGRQEGSQAKKFKIDLDYANKVLSMQEDESELAKVQEVVYVVTTAKIITEVVTTTSETITAASTIITAADAQVPAATLTAASDKGKGILVEEPKPLKKKQQIKQDEQYDRELHAKLNKNINWDEVIDHVKIKAKEDPAVKKYQALKRKPQTKAQARKNIMLYLKNVVGFKIDYFKGMSYDDILPIFEAKFNLNMAFLLKIKEHIEEDENKALQRLNETPAERAAKRQKLNEEVEELKRHLQIVPNEDDDVYTEATPLA